MKSKIIILISLFSLFFSGCGAGASSNAVRDYRLSVGTATMDDFTNLSSRILNRNRFVIDRVENRGTGAIIDTKFEYPALSNEEVLAGFEEVRYRLTLEARMKGSGGEMYNIRSIVSSYGRYAGSTEWIEIQTSEESKKRIKAFSGELKTEFENRIRSY
tara:strand:- start:273 stop:749 length:477 start_codon:yes stop_codon:yes gene_type:complete